MEFLIKINETVYEISQLVTKVSYTDKLNDGCSKLEFTLINDNLKIQNSSIVQFKYGGANIFYGFVFKHELNKKGEITVTAYDKLRYCKAKDSINVVRNTATDLVKRMCTYFGLKQGVLEDTKYILPTGVHDGDTWLDIVYTGINKTLENKGEWFVLRDEFGSISLRNITDLQTNLVLGDQSLCYDYNYGKSIDDEFYNQIKLFVKGDDKNDSQFVGKKDEESIKKYGMLQYYAEVDKSKFNISQAKAMAEALLGLYKQEKETLDLECLGDTRIRAGSSFFVQIEDVDLKNKRLIVRSVTHKYLPTHTMSLEVAI